MPFLDDDEARKKAQRNPLTEYFGEKGPVAAAPAPAAEPAPAPAPATNVGGGAQQRAPAPTNFANFSRVQSANRDVSSREASLYGQRATAKVDKARTSLDALRARFGGEVKAGTVAGAQQGFALPTGTGGGLMGEATRPSLGGGLTSDEMMVNAGRSYSGPGGLGDINNVDDTYAATLAAEQNLDALGSEGGMQALIQRQNQQGSIGGSKLSGALIGSAGRKDFDALRARFNPEGDLEKAETEAASQATAAGEQSKANAKQWGELGGAKVASDAAEAARLAAKATGEADKAKKREADKKMNADFDATVKDEGLLGAKSVFEYLDPTNYIGGGKRSAGMKFFGDLGQENYKGNISWLDSPLDRDVFSQMDAAQWEELAGLTGPAQRNWINTRAAELKNGSGRPRGTYQSARGH